MTTARDTATTPPDAGERALAALEQLLTAQRDALIAGDLSSLSTIQAKMHALLANPAWQRDVARNQDAARLRAGMQALAVNAQLAARGESSARRGLESLGAAPSTYGASGGLSAYAGAGRASRRALA